MSIDYINRTYRIAAKPGGRIKYTGDRQKGPQFGTIEGAQGAHLLIRLDGTKHAHPFHPTWEIEYDPRELSPEEESMSEAIGGINSVQGGL